MAVERACVGAKQQVWIWSEKTAAELHVREEASRTTTSSLRQRGNCGKTVKRLQVDTSLLQGM